MSMSEKPPSLVKTALIEGLQWGLNQAIKLDPEQANLFAELDEKVIQVTLTDLKQTLFVIFYGNEGRFALQSHLMGASDAHIKTTLTQWTHYQADQITGDVALGQALLTGLTNLEVDWEEALSKLTGDLLAHQIGSGVRQAQRQGQAFKQSMGESVKEYLQFEINALPTRAQFNHFTTEVDQLAQRLASLEQQLKAKGSHETD